MAFLFFVSVLNWGTPRNYDWPKSLAPDKRWLSISPIPTSLQGFSPTYRLQKSTALSLGENPSFLELLRANGLGEHGGRVEVVSRTDIDA
ncbi:hypothetical protein WG66_001886 [Moniliophthora roreri]|nr:hypothetical protein WG66_001886 [Moniliophthora roreri]